MADQDQIFQMVADPQFSQMNISEQRKALSAHDSTFTNVNDAELTKFVQAHQGSAKPDTSFDDSAIGGFINRLGTLAKGAASTFNPIPAAQSLAHGDIAGAIANTPAYRMAHGLNVAETQLGQQAKQQFQTRQYARGIVSAASMLDPLATGPVANINQLKDQGQSSTAAGAGTADILALAPGYRGSFAPPELNTGTVQGTLRQALRSKSPQFNADVKTALPAIQEQLAAGKSASSLPSFVDTLRAAKNAVWQKYSQRLAQTNQAGAEIDGNSIAQSQLNSLPDNITSQIDPGISAQIGKTFDVYAGKTFTPTQIESRIQAINNELGSKYAQMGKGVDYSAVARDPYIAPRLAEADALRQSLYDTIDKTSPSPEAAATLKRQYGALTSLEQATLKRQIGISAQAPFSLSDQLNLPAAAVDVIAGHFNPAMALARLGTRAIIRNRNNPDVLVNKAFTPSSTATSKAAFTGAGAGAETNAIPDETRQRLLQILNRQ